MKLYMAWRHMATLAWRHNHGRQRRHGPTRSPTSDLRGAQMFQSADRSAGQITGRLSDPLDPLDPLDD